MQAARTRLRVSERRACQVLGQVRSTQRYQARPPLWQAGLRQRVIELASQYGRYGYRTLHGLLIQEGWRVGRDQVYGIWRQEGLQVPQKQPKRARLWLTAGSCVRHRPAHKHHVWSYDFMADRTHDGKPFRILNVLDEYSRECLATHVQRRMTSQDVIFLLADLFVQHGCPKFIRSDNGPEFLAKRLMRWFETLAVQPLFITPGSPWENGYCESFNGKMRYELLNGEIFYSLTEAKIVLETWRQHYNTTRPHSSLGGKPPAPETRQPNLKLLEPLCST